MRTGMMDGLFDVEAVNYNVVLLRLLFILLADLGNKKKAGKSC